LRGRVVAGQDDMGGSSADRLTDQSGGLNGDILGAAGGSETHTLTEGQLPGHTHSFSATSSSNGAHTPKKFAVAPGDSTLTDSNSPAANSGALGNPAYTIQGATNPPTLGLSSSEGAHTHTVSGTSGSTGSGNAHNNVQPTFILNKIIFAGV